MKNLKNLKGANELSKNEQKSINGGVIHNGNWIFNSFGNENGFDFRCDSNSDCPNAVNPHTGNYCAGYCFQYATGSKCQIDVC